MKLFQFDPPERNGEGTIDVYGTARAIDTIIALASEMSGVTPHERPTPHTLRLTFTDKTAVDELIKRSVYALPYQKETS